MLGLLRNRRQRDLEPMLRPARAWRVHVRLPLPDDGRWRQWDLDGVLYDPRPPASGPEVEVSFLVAATTAAIAERVGCRLFERAGYSLLATKAVAA